MPKLTLHRRQMFKLSIPYWVFINEHPIGIMQGKEVSIELPPAQFDLSIKILFRLFKWQFSIGGKRKVCLSEGEHLHLMIIDKLHIYRTGKKIHVLAGKAQPKIIREDKLNDLLK